MVSTETVIISRLSGEDRTLLDKQLLNASKTPPPLDLQSLHAKIPRQIFIVENRICKPSVCESHNE